MIAMIVERDQQRRFPHDAAAGGLRAQLEGCDLGADLRVALFAHLAASAASSSNRSGRSPRSDSPGVMDSTLRRIVPCCRPSWLSASRAAGEVSCSRAGGGGGEVFVFLAIDVEILLGVLCRQHAVVACRTQQLGDLAFELGAGACGIRAFLHGPLRLVGEHTDLVAGITERDEQRQGGQYETEHHQPAQGLGSWPTHGLPL